MCATSHSSDTINTTSEEEEDSSVAVEDGDETHMMLALVKKSYKQIICLLICGLNY